MALEHAPPPKQQIACTRSFGHPVTAQHELRQAITEFTSRAAEKLRRQEVKASQILTFVRTSPFRRQDEQYSRSMIWPLVRPTQDTAVLVQAALATLQAIYRPGFNYAKAGVMLLELSPQGMEQAERDWGQGVEGDSNRGEAGQGGHSADSPDSTDNPDRNLEKVPLKVNIIYGEVLR